MVGQRPCALRVGTRELSGDHRTATLTRLRGEVIADYRHASRPGAMSAFTVLDKESPSEAFVPALSTPATNVPPNK